MSAATLAYITAILNLAPMVIQLGMDVVPFAERLWAAVSGGGDPTDADWAALKALEAPLRAQLDTPVDGAPIATPIVDAAHAGVTAPAPPAPTS